MEIMHLKEQDYVTTRWSGGTTTQFAISPANALYAHRDFTWRLSSATVDDDESDFTALPDYERWISVLQGGMKLSHNGKDFVELQPLTAYQFSGGIPTHSWGKCRDFNLMLRRESCSGFVCPFSLKAGSEISMTVMANASDVFIFCASGETECVAGDRTILLRPMESLLIRSPELSRVVLRSASAADLFTAQMFPRARA